MVAGWLVGASGLWAPTTKAWKALRGQGEEEGRASGWAARVQGYLRGSEPLGLAGLRLVVANSEGGLDT